MEVKKQCVLSDIWCPKMMTLDSTDILLCAASALSQCDAITLGSFQRAIESCCSG